MIHVVSDDPDGADKLAALRRGAGDADLVQLNTTVFDGQRVSFEELMAACEAMPFLVERRLVIVRGLLSRFEPKAAGREGAGGKAAERKPPELVRQLEGYFARLPQSTVLVFVEQVTITKRNPLHKGLVAAEAQLAQTPELRGDALARWIAGRVAVKGGRIGTGAATLLASYGEYDLTALDNELEMLVTYAGAGEIDERAVGQMVTAERERNVYKMCDAIAEGNTAVALGQLHELLNQGEHPLWVLTMVVRHFRLLIQVQELQAQGWRADAMASRLRLPPYAVERLQRQLRRFRAFEQLERVYRRLLEMDAASKTGGRDLLVNIELLIGELAPPTSRPKGLARPSV